MLAATAELAVLGQIDFNRRALARVAFIYTLGSRSISDLKRLDQPEGARPYE
jgi:hypothetical protein